MRADAVGDREGVCSRAVGTGMETEEMSVVADSGLHVAEASETSATIMIVDDEYANVALLTGILSRAGYTHTIGINDPHQALEHILASPPDLLLLDLHMPGLDGFGLMEAIDDVRRHDGSAVPIIILTADVTIGGEAAGRCRTGRDDLSARSRSTWSRCCCGSRTLLARAGPRSVRVAAIAAASCWSNPGAGSDRVTSTAARRRGARAAWRWRRSYRDDDDRSAHAAGGDGRLRRLIARSASGSLPDRQAGAAPSDAATTA